MTKSSIVSKSVQVLDIICSSRARLTYSQITEAAGLPKSSTHRLLSILREEGLVALDPLRSVYLPGPKLMGWATNVLSAADLPEISASTLMRLSRDVRAGTAISILDGNQVLWLRIVDYPSRHRQAPRVGDRTPAHVCAAGKALLAFSDGARRQAILGEMDLEAFTHRTITDPADFAKELQKVREAGIAISNREEYLQDVGLAAPVFDHNSDVIAAVSMWDMTGRRSADDLLAYRQKLLDAAAEISAQLGYADVAGGQGQLNATRPA
ncbi:MAG: IclR family transcriptional regulator [Albidovulum sp.]|uniref:IclR family transcriptional regulator n=1 Tax=Albidovulum sp. TaxID=1872424 RepID=UPI003C7EF5EC